MKRHQDSHFAEEETQTEPSAEPTLQSAEPSALAEMLRALDHAATALGQLAATNMGASQHVEKMRERLDAARRRI